MQIKCKRIINGKTYNTETATFVKSVGRIFGSHDENARAQALYQTRFGAYFLYNLDETRDDDGYQWIKPILSIEAQAWLEEHASSQPELIERHFGEMPEAGAREVKYSLRMPESLRDRLAAHASTNKQSLNAWIIRCLESCASQTENS